jgi:hypothetical protein
MGLSGKAFLDVSENPINQNLKWHEMVLCWYSRTTCELLTTEVPYQWSGWDFTSELYVDKALSPLKVIVRLS